MIPSVVWHLKNTIITVGNYVLQEIIVLIQNNDNKKKFNL